MIERYLFLLQIVAPIFLVMGVGFLLRKKNLLSSEADRSLIKVVVTLLFPCLALHSIIGNEALRNPANLVWPPLLGFGSCVLGIIAARLARPLLGPVDDRARRAFVYSTAIQNYSYVTLPLCAVLFDKNTTGVLFAFILGVELAFWTVVLWQLTGKMEGRKWYHLLNPPVVGIVLAMILNNLDAHHWMPGALDVAFQMIGQCAVPMALMLSGALIADHMNFRSLQAGSRTIGVATLVRILIVPFLIMATARFLPVDHSLKAVLILEAAMPAGIFSIVVTKIYHGDITTALQVMVGTSLVGLITIPLWLGIGLWWIPIPH